MKKCLALLLFFCSLLITGCNTQRGDLFDGTSTDQWTLSGNVSVQDHLLSLTGEEASAILKNGKYTDFDLSMELRTTPGGKGFIGIHTDETGKGYKIAINNDRDDSVWWRMTGSLLSVRNLTKSFIRENEWFTMNIRVLGQSVIVKINGEPVVEYFEPEFPFRLPANKDALISQGTFALVSTGPGEIQFKHISVEELDSKEVDRESQWARGVDEQTDEIIRLHQDDFPVLDYHVHLKGGLTREVAAKQSRRTGINYVLAPNCGVGFPISTDAQIYDYLNTMRSEPFILAMQAEGREWLTIFSPEVRDEFDFVFTDALTFTDDKGRRTRLWINDEVFIENEQQYMDIIVDRICTVLEEPVDVYVNPCFLPESMSDRYDEFWTEARMNKVVDALAKSGKALEINELYNIPNKAILMKAKEAGVKFTFGSNNVTPSVSKLEYSLRMKKECDLRSEHMYKPKIKI